MEFLRLSLGFRTYRVSELSLFAGLRVWIVAVSDVQSRAREATRDGGKPLL